MLLASSCAVFSDLSGELKPLHVRLISNDKSIKEAAVREYLGLDEAAGEQEILKIVRSFETDEDPYTRGRKLDLLVELKAGPGIIIPLIEAVSRNKSILDHKEIISFLAAMKPDQKDIPKFKELLKTGAWESRMLAMTAASLLSKKAETLMPELMDMLEAFGADAGRYSRIFDCMAMINPEIAVTGVIKDITNPDGQIRRNAVEKLVELQAYLAAKLPAKKDIVPALIRALYSGDQALSALAQEGLSKIDDADARNAAQSFMKMGRMALNMLYKMAGTTAEEVFKKQEQGIDKKINDYYKKIGREDAVKK